MQIDIQEVENCKLSVRCEATPEEINEKRNDVLKIFKNAPIPGFRKGKADAKAIRQFYRKQVDDSVQRALTEQSYHNALFEKNIKTWGQPEVGNVFFDGKSFECEFTLYRKPDVTLSQYKGFTLPKPQSLLTEDGYIEQLLQNLRVQFGTDIHLNVGDTISLDDAVTIDYAGTSDGNPVEALTAQNMEFIVGKTMLPGFDTALVGAVIGTPFQFELAMPDNVIPSLAGKVVTFNVAITAGSRKELAPLDNDLAKRLDRDNLDKLREDLRGVASSKIAERERASLMQNLQAHLLKNVTVDVPEWMIAAELRYIITGAQINWSTLRPEDQKAYKELAEKNVKLVLALETIRESEPEAQLSDEETANTLKRVLQMNDPETSIMDQVKNLSKNGAYEIMVSNIKNEYTLDFLLKSCTIVE